MAGDDLSLAADLQKRSSDAEGADRYDEAIRLETELLALRIKAQGPDHWEARTQEWDLSRLRTLAALPASDRAEWRAAVEGCERAQELKRAGRYADAEPLFQQALDVSLRVFGDDHPETATSYSNLGGVWNDLGRYADAQPLCQKALELSLRLLTEDHPDTARCYNNLASNLNDLGKYAEAQPLYRKALDLNRRLFGEQHAHTIAGYNNLATNLDEQAKHLEAQPFHKRALELRRALFGENHLDVARSYNNLGYNLRAQGKFVEAQALYQKALDLRVALLGENHPDTARSYSNLAVSLDLQAKYAEAQPLFEKALNLRLALFGEGHPDTASSFGNLARCLTSQGACGAAQPLYEKALELQIRLLGADHPRTAASMGDLALNFAEQGRFADALQLRQQALRSYLRSIGETHPDTANAYNEVANSLSDQGDYAAADPLYRKSLGLYLAAFGKEHSEIARGYNNLAANLKAQSKFAEAHEYYEQALDLQIKLFGEEHPETAAVYNNLAANHNAQGNHDDAQRLYQKALDLNRKLLGEVHPRTATSYLNLAGILGDQRQHAEAQPLLETALNVFLTSYGSNHPDTFVCLRSLGANQLAQGKDEAALQWLQRAVAGYETSRLRVAERGLDRAVFGAERSPYPLLAFTQARLSHAVPAWAAAEQNLARGASDEGATRRHRELTRQEERVQSDLASRLTRLDALVVQLVTNRSSVDATGRDELQRVLAERQEMESELARLAAALSQREVAALADVQSAIPRDAALILWIDDAVVEQWGCVVRSTGEPAWERLPLPAATNEKATGTATSLAKQLRTALSEGSVPSEVAALAEGFYAQRIAPLERHLEGVRRLYVVPVGEMAGVPVEVLTDRYEVCYVPSGTFLARLKDRPAPQGTSLLAVGDPVYPVTGSAEEPPLPPGGLLLTQVVPGGNADQAQLLAGDVLLAYAGTELNSVESLGKLIEEHGEEPSIAVSVWRDGQTTERKLGAGRLGVALHRQPAPAAIAARRQTDQLLASVSRGGEWAELPGTAVEVARLGALVAQNQATVLTRADASESALEQLRADGKLKEFRYLHFATHGEPNNARAFESALILAQDQVSAELPIGDGKHFDGRLTASEVLEEWELDADLVTLSACESALGRPGGGDGLLGFAQAFLLAGARSVCLSLWKVDDTATALLMDRFYQNLLGRRAGLDGLLPKATALAEAKQWLRNLTAEEATQRAADLSQGVARGRNEPALPLVVPPTAAAEPAAARPFAHPRYWAAFVLIGDPG